MFDLGTSEDDVDIDIKYCGYCHTDIHLINNDWGFTTYPAVGGHEVSTLLYFFKDVINKINRNNKILENILKDCKTLEFHNPSLCWWI